MSDIDRIREWHSEHHAADRSTCQTCHTPWPCDTRIETERADRAEAALDEATRGNGPYILTLREQRDAAEADADRLAEALRLARRWRLGYFVTTPWATINRALRQHDNHRDTATVEGTSPPDNPTEPLFRRQRNRHPDEKSRRPQAQERHRRAREYAVVAAAVRWRKADTADPSMWPDEQRELAEAVDALLRPETGTHQTPEPDAHVHSYIWSVTGTSDHHPPASAVCECGHRFVEDAP